MKWGRTKLSVAAIALAGVGCCPKQETTKAAPLQCDLNPTAGTLVTVKGTARYKISVSGDGVVEASSYSDGQKLVLVDNPKQPFSVTVQLEVGDLFQSSSYGHLTLGSISATDTFTPADGSAVIENAQACYIGPLQQL